MENFDNYNDFREFLRVRGYTLTSLVDELNKQEVMTISRQTASSWNTGKHHPSPEKLQKIAEFFGVKVVEIYQVMLNGAKYHEKETA